MRKIFILWITLLISTGSIIAQAPQAFNYQAVLRNASGELLSNAEVEVGVSILQGNPSGFVVFHENHNTSSNEYGLLNLQIGSVNTGGLSEIDWSAGPYFIEISIDGTLLGTSQLLSVPYALYAGTSGNANVSGNESAFNGWDKDAGDDMLLTDDQSIEGNKIFLDSIWARGLALPYTFGADYNYVGTKGAYIGFGHEGYSEDFIGYKNNTFYFKDSPGGGDTEDPDVVIGGKLGIGTDSPGSILDIAEPNSISNSGLVYKGQLRIFSNLSPQIDLIDKDHQDWSIRANANRLFFIGESHNSSMAIQQDGKVGIGTETPEGVLEIVEPEGFSTTGLHSTGQLRVFGEVNSQIDLIDKEHQDWLIRAESNDLHFIGESDTSRMIIQQDGNVGIGTRTPTEKLEVQGIIYSQTDGFKFPDGTIQTTASTETSESNGWTDDGTVVRLNVSSDNVGIGTTNPRARLSVGSDGNNLSAIYGYKNGYASRGVHGRGSNSGDGVCYGGYFEAVGEDGRAVFGHVSRNTAYAGYFEGRGYFSGNVGIGIKNPESPLDVKGNITVRDENDGTVVIQMGTGLDYAEGFNVADKNNIEPGTVLCIDPENPGKLKISQQAYDCKVAGIVAGAGNLGSGVTLGSGVHDFNVALAGRVFCNVDATKIAVKTGDLLTTSDTPGYAQKVTNYSESQGAVLGKAMQNLDKGSKGKILVLVTLQ